MPDMRLIFTPAASTAPDPGAPWRERMPCGHDGHACQWPGGSAYAYCAICDLDWERRGERGAWVSA